ncbi:hypothetical protein JCM11251_003952 [Rhodosporidiobolus azoricus]
MSTYGDVDGLLAPGPTGQGMDGSPAIGLVSPALGHPSSSRPSRPPSPQPPISSGNYYPSFDHAPPLPSGSHSQLEAAPGALSHPATPETHNARVPSGANGGATFSAPSLKVLQWTPQMGDEGSQVTIIMDAAAVRGGNGQFASPAVGSPRKNGGGMTNGRRFVVVFGQAEAPTRFTRAQQIDGNGVGQSMNAGPNEEDAFVVLTTFVPSRHSMGPAGERIMVFVHVKGEGNAVIESTILGEWDAQSPATPTRVNALKRSGEDLVSNREGPGTRSPAISVHNSPVRQQGEWASPSLGNQAVQGLQSPAVPQGHPPPPPLHVDIPAPPPLPQQSVARQPELIRTSQIHAPKNGYGATYSHKVVLKLQGDLNTMAMGWSNEEWTNRRRLIQFWPQQDGNVINVAFRPIAQNEYVQNSIVISCIFRDEWNECFVTSVDTIYLLEALVGSRFTVEEKNRIRRNLEGFKPMTVSKSKVDAEPFFKLIMSFPNPKPRNIEKDVKVFPWKILAQALKKIMSKYSANYPLAADGTPLAGPLPPPTFDSSAAPTPTVGSDPRFPPPLSPHLTSPHLTHASPHISHASPHIPHQSPHIPHQSPHLGAPSHGFAHHDSRSPRPDMHRSPVMPLSPHEAQQQGGFSTSYSQSGYTADALDPYATLPGASYSQYAPVSQQQQHNNNLFPSAEDYGVPHNHGDRLLPPTSTAGGNGGQLNHLRSFSEGVQYGAGPGSAYSSPQQPQQRWGDGSMAPPTPVLPHDGHEAHDANGEA